VRKSWVLLLLVSVVFSACGDDDGVEGPNNRFSAQDTFSVDVTKSSRRGLNLQAASGSITVSGLPGATAVSVFAITRVESDSQADADARISQIEVEVDSTADAVLVETVQPNNTQGRNYIVDYTITCPVDFQVVVASANGSIVVRDIDGGVSIGAANSGVVLDDVVGDTEVILANGTIDGRVTIPTNGTINMNAANGKINLEIPQSTSAQFLAVAGNGSVTVVGLFLQNSVIEPNRVSGVLGAGDGTVTLNAANGEIYVEGF
jgi:DUF4097 and DUF4098 domain-containing protein YvlB